jgi:hypothetical protein
MKIKNSSLTRFFKFFVPSFILIILAALGLKFQLFNLLALIVFCILAIGIIIAFVFGIVNSFKNK